MQWRATCSRRNAFAKTQLILIFEQHLRLQNIGKICLHFAEQTEEDPSICICLVLFRCSGSGHVSSFYSSPCQVIYNIL